MIKRKTFNHGWWYSYCLHNEKASELGNGFSSLHSYLHNMFDRCPNEYFQNGPRGSKLKFPAPNLKVEHHKEHNICQLAKNALEINAERFNSDHLKVQMFMLENDNRTIAIEVPVWLLPSEFERFGSYFKGSEHLTGHIDLLNFEKGKIWVWDYKPGASREKYAATQTLFYAVMLSKRTGIPLEKFMCGWFDSANAYTFKPEIQDLSDF